MKISDNFLGHLEQLIVIESTSLFSETTIENIHYGEGVEKNYNEESPTINI